MWLHVEGKWKPTDGGGAPTRTQCCLRPYGRDLLKRNNDAHWPLRGVQDALELHVGEQNSKSKELSGGASQVLRNVSSREQATEVGGPLAD